MVPVLDSWLSVTFVTSIRQFFIDPPESWCWSDEDDRLHLPWNSNVTLFWFIYLVFLPQVSLKNFFFVPLPFLMPREDSLLPGTRIGFYLWLQILGKLTFSRTVFMSTCIFIQLDWIWVRPRSVEWFFNCSIDASFGVLRMIYIHLGSRFTFNILRSVVGISFVRILI